MLIGFPIVSLVGHFVGCSVGLGPPTRHISGHESSHDAVLRFPVLRQRRRLPE